MAQHSRGSSLPIATMSNWMQLPPSDPNYKLMCVKGTAGTGKTSAIVELHDELRRRGENVIVMAPTNKACKVVREGSIPCSTIHSLCYANRPTGKVEYVKDVMFDPNTSKILLDPQGNPRYTVVEKEVYEYIWSQTAMFRKARNLGIELQSGQTVYVILDESSMIAADKWLNLMLDTPQCRLIAVGDPTQLPPIEETDELRRKLKNKPGDPRAQIWRDRIALLQPYEFYFLNMPATVTLTHNYRQSATSNIPNILHNILQSGTYPVPFTAPDVDIQDWVHLKKTIEADSYLLTEPILGTPNMVLAHTNATVALVNTQIRHKLHGAALAATPLDKWHWPINGDVLYVTSRFDHGNKTLLYKGDTVTLTSDPVYDLVTNIFYADCYTDDGATFASLPFSMDGTTGLKKKDRMIRAVSNVFGYALTVHKAQGSQWDAVVVIDEMKFWNNHRRNWRYTAASRAAKSLTIYKVA